MVTIHSRYAYNVPIKSSIMEPLMVQCLVTIWNHFRVVYETFLHRKLQNL